MTLWLKIDELCICVCVHAGQAPAAAAAAVAAVAVRSSRLSLVADFDMLVTCRQLGHQCWTHTWFDVNSHVLMIVSQSVVSEKCFAIVVLKLCELIIHCN